MRLWMMDVPVIAPAPRPTAGALRSALAKLRLAAIYTAFGISIAFSLALVLGMFPD